MPRPEDKPFAIPRLMVWEAWRQVKADKRAPGVDGQDLDAFEADLEDNLYKIGNRMSSGTWFPPPVRAVEIPKHVSELSARWRRGPTGCIVAASATTAGCRWSWVRRRSCWLSL